MIKFHKTLHLELYSWCYALKCTFCVPMCCNMADEEVAHSCEGGYQHHWEANPGVWVCCVCVCVCVSVCACVWVCVHVHACAHTQEEGRWHISEIMRSHNPSNTQRHIRMDVLEKSFEWYPVTILFSNPCTHNISRGSDQSAISCVEIHISRIFTTISFWISRFLMLHNNLMFKLMPKSSTKKHRGCSGALLGTTILVRFEIQVTWHRWNWSQHP